MEVKTEGNLSEPLDITYLHDAWRPKSADITVPHMLESVYMLVEPYQVDFSHQRRWSAGV